MEYESLPRSRILVVCGNYGSGKTELSLNMALALAEHEPTTLVDLDIVNPYFRSSEQTKMLENHGVKVLYPTFAMTTVDIPALPAQIQSIFADKSRRVIIDVGGDDTGAAALGQYHHYFAQDDVFVLYVVNVCRPLSADADSICDLLARIQAKGRVTVGALVNNANIAWETTPEQLLRGDEILREVTQRLDLPVRHYVGKADVLARIPEGSALCGEPLTLTVYMRPEWL